MNKIYGIKNCGSVKKALEWFVARDLPFEFHDFRKEGIDPVLLDEWIAKTSCDVLLNRKGLLWRKLDKARREAVCDNPEGMRALMLENPVIIKRPVIVHPDPSALTRKPGKGSPADAGHRQSERRPPATAAFFLKDA